MRTLENPQEKSTAFCGFEAVIHRGEASFSILNETTKYMVTHEKSIPYLVEI